MCYNPKCEKCGAEYVLAWALDGPDYYLCTVCGNTAQAHYAPVALTVV
jgi:uncharacterized protein (DUF983 family)